MSEIDEKVVCDLCGEYVFRRSIHIENMYRYDGSSKSSYIRSLMEIEGVREEVATSWAEHGLYEMCNTKKRNCPECNSELKTWRAKICLSCGANFDPLVPRGNT